MVSATHLQNQKGTNRSKSTEDRHASKAEKLSRPQGMQTAGNNKDCQRTMNIYLERNFFPGKDVELGKASKEVLQ